MKRDHTVAPAEEGDDDGRNNDVVGDTRSGPGAPGEKAHATATAGPTCLDADGVPIRQKDPTRAPNRTRAPLWRADREGKTAQRPPQLASIIIMKKRESSSRRFAITDRRLCGRPGSLMRIEDGGGWALRSLAQPELAGRAPRRRYDGASARR
jgi:hypothetical protein